MTTSVFYERFERHDDGQGLAAHATTYCAGCGHGVAQKYLAEAIDALGVQDRTVLVSPVGCSVFSYYYFDVGNTQAAHGRAPAVAIGHKTANPDSVVICYQGDGDLASIGLAEILSAAQLGLAITVIFINNAVYGMTGGQMAPTTLVGQQTSTTPAGRGPLQGKPMRVAEMLATLDGPVFIERVALYDNKRRTHARRSIEKALRCQVDGTGFAFIEVLAECPTYLGVDPEAAEDWVREELAAVFPLGVYKDTTGEARAATLPTPSYDTELLLSVMGTTTTSAERFATTFPTHLDPSDVAIKLAGAGGDGAQTAAMVLTRAAINEGFDATHIPSYGPESRGGTSYADVHLAEVEVLSPAAPRPQVLLAFNQPSLERFAPAVREGGMVIYDATVASCDGLDVAPSVRCLGVPLTQAAFALGDHRLKNVLALGALQAVTDVLPAASFRVALEQTLGTKRVATADLNAAFDRGRALVADLTAAIPPR